MTKEIARAAFSIWAAILCTVVLVEASASQHVSAISLAALA